MKPAHLAALQRQWDAWGRKDALWAAVTRTDKRGRRWDVAEFLRSGEDEVDGALRHLGELGVDVPRGRALDFGCGAGRFTQALAARFERADGVDIAPSMLREARRLNVHGPRCSYHLNARADLSRFPDASFTFVYSMLVLQHMRPEYAKRYLAELLRVLAPGGALVLQLPTQVPAPASGTPPPALGGAAPAPLPEGAFQARLTASSSAAGVSVRAGELLMVEVAVENLSPHPWPATGSADGRFQVQLANRWLDARGAIVVQDDGRSALETDLQPGAEARLEHFCGAPAAGGDYALELDMVQEGVAWFQERGSRPIRIPCRVEGKAPVAADGPRAGRRPSLFAGFRARHPRLHVALRGLGLVAFYRSSSARARRWWTEWQRWRRPRLVMEMHAVPSGEVAEIVAAGGGRILDTATERWPNGIVSARYWVVKAGD
jgi:SAM-dependent methyltransferase